MKGRLADVRANTRATLAKQADAASQSKQRQKARLAKLLRDMQSYKQDMQSTMEHMRRTKKRLVRSYLSKANDRVERMIQKKNNDRQNIAKATAKFAENRGMLISKEKLLEKQDEFIKAKIAKDRLEQDKLIKLMTRERELAEGVLNSQEKHIRDLDWKLIVGKEAVAHLRR